MSSIIQKEYARGAAGDAKTVYHLVSKRITLTMAAGVTATDTFTLPRGAIFDTIKVETATAFSGSPTNINLTIGTAAAGAQVLAATDIKAQGHVTGTVVAAFDCVGTAASADVTLYPQIAAVGGTNPAGTAEVFVTYRMPRP